MGTEEMLSVTNSERRIGVTIAAGEFSYSSYCWDGPSLLEQQCGNSMVRCVNIQHKKVFYVYRNDVKDHAKP
jgi:hypothetical protein